MNQEIYDYDTLNELVRRIRELIEEKEKTEGANAKKLIKDELNKMAKVLAEQGFDEVKFVNYLEKTFSEKSFRDGKFKEALREVLGKSNFQGDAFKGGWSKESNLNHLKEVFKGKWSDEGKYIGDADFVNENVNKLFDPLKKNVEDKLTTAKNEVDTKLGGVDTKLKEADEKIKIKLQEADTKIENASKEVKDKLKELKPEVVKALVEELKDPKSQTSAELRDFMDKDNFYPLEWKDGDAFPKDRAGKAKNTRDIALLQEQYKAEAESAREWVKFFKRHGIPEAKYDLWRKELNTEPEEAEKLYTIAKSKGKEVIERDFDLDEQNQIDKSHTPDEITDMWKNKIPQSVKEKVWEKFFKDREKDGRIDREWYKNWTTNENLSIEIATLLYDNGWNNSPNDLIGKDKKIAVFTTIEDVKGNKKEIKTENVDPLKYSGVELRKVHSFIIRRIETEEDLDKFPNVKGNDLNQSIDKESLPEFFKEYDQDKVPDIRTYEEVKKLRDEKVRELFKGYFLGAKDGLGDFTNWTIKDYESWRTANTGLRNNGRDQRQAYDNGWKKPNEIIGGKTEYNGVKGIEVLKYKPEQIDNAIKDANQVISNVQKFESLRELEPNNFKTNQEIIDKLKGQSELLPIGTLDKIDQAIKDAKDILYYHLDEPLDGGIERGRLSKIEQDIRKEWSPKTYDPLTTEILNDFIKTYGKNSVKVKGEKEWKNKSNQKVKWDSPDIDEWLKNRGAYKMDDTEEGKKIIKKEDDLPIEKRGRELLPYSYKKANFNVDKLGDRNSYCETELDKDGDPIIKGTKGHLPFATGIGKSTKVVNCFVGGGENDEIRGGKGNRVILVMPDQFLVEAVGDHQAGWMQTWGCVVHADEQLNQKVKKGTYIPATEEEIRKGDFDVKSIFKSHGKYKVLKNNLIPKTEKGLSIITGDELLGFMARDLLLADPTDPISKWQPIKGAVGWFNTQEEINDWRKDAESKIIDKDNDIVMFDEGHFAIPSYQALQVQAIHASYRVNRLSATFEGQPFSITSTYARTNLYAGYGGREVLDPAMPTGKIKIDKPNQIERLSALRKTTPDKLGWDEQTKKPIEIDVILEERLQIGKTALFIPNLNSLAREQQTVLKDNAWIAYTPEWDPYLEPVSYGMPIGCLNLLGQQHGVGTNGDFDTVVLGGKMWIKSLKKRFQYEYEDSANLNQADGIQEIGRTGRSKVGSAVILSPKWEELNTKDDVAAAMVNATFNGKVADIYKKGYEMIQDPIMLRTALAIPHKFGKIPEEILIGLKVDDATEKARVLNKQPLTEIQWRKANEPQPDIKIMGMSFGKPDEGLWNRYLGNVPPITMKKEVAKERLLQNIATFISEDVNFPEKIEVWRQSNLIEYIWGDEVKTQSGKEKAIAEVREVLNGVIKKGIDNYNSEDFNSIKKISKNKEVIKNVADYYNVADAFINISPQKNQEGKMVLTIQIEKPEIKREIL